MKPYLTYAQYLKTYSRKLRLTMTEAELILWSKLRRKQLLGVQFYRQKPLGPYIVDFYAPKMKLIVEVDGAQHYDVGQNEKDKTHDAYLKSIHRIVLRYSNHEVLTDLESVVSDIYEFIAVGVKL